MRKTVSQKLKYGSRVALFGDSMTDWNFSIGSPSAVSFAPSTNTLTITSTAHPFCKGQAFDYFNRAYTSTYDKLHLTVASVVDANNFTTVLPTGRDYSDMPTGAITRTSCYMSFLQQYSAKSWFTWLNALLGNRFNILINSAQSGDRTFDGIRRLPAEMAIWKTLGVNTVVMQAFGINDLTYGSGAGTTNNVVGIVQNLQYMFDTMRNEGFRLVVGTLTPVETGEVRAQKSIMVAAQMVNEWIWKYSRLYSDTVCVIDTYDVVVNRTDATGLAKSGYVNSTDHIHLSNTGAYSIAKNADNLARISAFFPVWKSTLPQSTLDSLLNATLSSPTATVGVDLVTVTVTSASSYIEKGQEVFVSGATGSFTALNGRQVSTTSTGSGTFSFVLSTPAGASGSVTGTLVISPSRQLFPDPLLQTTSGGTPTGAGLTGTVAGKLNLSTGAGITAVASVAAEPNGYGNEQVVTISNATTATDIVRFSFHNSSGAGSAFAGLISGRTYVLEAQLRLTSTSWAGTPISELNFNGTITANGSTETWTTNAFNQYETVLPLIQAGAPLTETFHAKTPPITLPLGVSLNSLQMNFNIRIQAAFSGTDTLVLALSRIAVRDVTEDGMQSVTFSP